MVMLGLDIMFLICILWLRMVILASQRKGSVKGSQRRGYYVFNDIDTAQYDINGKPTTVQMLILSPYVSAILLI